MSELTSRERLLHLFRGEPIDRIPISTRIAPNFTQEYFDSSDVDIVEGAYEIYRRFRMDIIDWNCTPHFEFADFTTEGSGWKPVVITEESGSTSHEIVTVETPGGRLRRIISITRLSKYEEERALTEYPIKGERYINVFSVSVGASTTIGPLGMTNKSIGGADFSIPPTGQPGVSGGIGLNNIGLLVRTTGLVSGGDVTAKTFNLNDGSSVNLKAVASDGIPADGSYVVVTGIVSCEKLGPEAKPLLRVTTWQVVQTP